MAFVSVSLHALFQVRHFLLVSVSLFFFNYENCVDQFIILFSFSKNPINWILKLSLTSVYPFFFLIFFCHYGFLGCHFFKYVFQFTKFIFSNINLPYIAGPPKNPMACSNRKLITVLIFFTCIWHNFSIFSFTLWMFQVHLV